MCYLLTGSFTWIFQAENEFYIVGYNMEKKERQLWKTCVLLLSRESSPLRAPLLGLWNGLRLKTTSLWDLEHGAAAVLSPCSWTWPKQAGQTMFAFFCGPAEGRAVLPSLALGKDCNCTSSVNGIHFYHSEHSWASVDSKKLWAKKPILEIIGKELSYCLKIILWWHGLIRSLFVVHYSLKMQFL